MWVKGDFLYTVSYERLFPFRTGKDETGRRMYEHPQLSKEEREAVWKCVFNGMGRNDIVKMLDLAKTIT